jgi:uncharacterized membrane protein YfcA
MSAEPAQPTVGQVLSALGDAATQLGSYVANVVDEQPALALGGALAAGFLAGGGLTSPLGSRLTTTTLRATLGNVATLVALDLVRRALENGASAGPESAGTE